MDYDLIIAGGGIAGATLGKVIAESGARVLIIERELKFRERIRGELVHPWGVAEASDLGIYELLLSKCAHEIRWLTSYSGTGEIRRRDLVATTPRHTGALGFYHPEMQEVLLEAAANAGAEVQRGASVVDIDRGEPVAAIIEKGGRRQRLSTRLVVGADGRQSRVRKQAGFDLLKDPERLVIAGVLLEGVDVAEDSVHILINSEMGQMPLVVPIGAQRFRSYFAYRKQDVPRRLSGDRQLSNFVAACKGAGMPEAWFKSIRLLGPLASFEAADRWVSHPYAKGVVLIGDAAAASDPSWGCGLSLALRDVRTLRDKLSADDDWDRAADAYADSQDQYYGALHRILGWMTDLFMELGTDAEQRRSQALPRFVDEPDRVPDLIGLGPDAPNDESAKRRFFGEH